MLLIGNLGDCHIYLDQVDGIVESQYFMGKYPEYSYSSDNDYFGILILSRQLSRELRRIHEIHHTSIYADSLHQ